MKNRAAKAVLIGASCCFFLLAGCTAILGDFTVAEPVPDGAAPAPSAIGSDGSTGTESGGPAVTKNDAAVGTPSACDGSSCPDAPAPTGQEHVVWVNASGFSPVNIRIKKGEAVTWKWYAGMHSVTSGVLCSHDQNFDSGMLTPPSSYSHAFTTSAVFMYYSGEDCANFTGSVTVEP